MHIFMIHWIMPWKLLYLSILWNPQLHEFVDIAFLVWESPSKLEWLKTFMLSMVLEALQESSHSSTI